VRWSWLQAGEVHGQVLVFCEKLRLARHKPLRSATIPIASTLATRLSQARKMLETARDGQFSPAGRRWPKSSPSLPRRPGAIFSSTAPALAAVETSDRVEASLTAKKLPLRAALGELLRPLGLTYRAIGPSTIQVTSKEAAEERLDLEFYPVGSWLATKNSPLPLGEGQGVRAAY